jgi:type II secretory pathway component GspD/PulD (secretin)
MNPKSALSATALLLALFTFAPIPSAHAQTATESPKAAPAHADPASWPVRTFYMKTTDLDAMNDVSYVLRNMLSHDTSISMVRAQQAFVIRLNPADIPIVEKILNDIDRPLKTYRLTYTLSEMDGEKRIGVQHFAMVLVSGQQTQMRQGSKVPTSTGPMQVSYTDIGMNFDTTLQDMGTTARLRFDVEQSSLASATSDPTQNPNTPTMRQTTLKGEATLTPGKPLMLGSIDFPGSTRRLDVEALMEPLP